jgi:hypothetical protein
VYGFPIEDPEYSAVYTNFPNTWHYVSGGCVIYSDSPKYKIIRFCPECRRLETEWREGRKKKSKQSSGTDK